MATSKIPLIFLTLTLGLLGLTTAQRSYLRADGNSGGTYSLLNSFLGGTAYEVPDCGHSGSHITQQTDSELGIPVFNFAAHVSSDSDRCQNYDRQRTEIKTYEPSPAQFKGFNGDRVSYSWDVRLNSAFQPSTQFTHIFQVKAVGGDDSMPFITITPRLKSGGQKVLQLMYAGANSQQAAVWEGPLADFAGKWIHIVAEYTCGLSGRFHLRIKRKDNDQQLMTYTNNNLVMWRSGNTFLRPKWGIYRSLNDAGNLRNENVYFNNFCLAKDEPLCT
jgi:hypothetical protein